MNHSDVRVLLLQLRRDRVMREQERADVLRSGGLAHHQLEVIDGLSEELTIERLQGKHLFIVGGSGDFTIRDRLPFTGALREILAYCRLADFPVFGACWGGQFMAEVFGGRVAYAPEREETGTVAIDRTAAGAHDPLFGALPGSFRAQTGHHDAVSELPVGAINLASTESCPIQAFTWPGSAQYGFLFHAELDSHGLRARMGHYRHYAPDAGQLEALMARIVDSPETEHFIQEFVTRIVVPRYTETPKTPAPVRELAKAFYAEIPEPGEQENPPL